MPVQSNVAIQNVGTIAWDGTTAFPFDIRKFTRFAWSFQVVTTLTADAVLKVQAAAPSAADNCVPDTFDDVAALATCQSPVTAGDLATVTIPAGTVAGTICAGTIPCRPGAFVQLAAVSGDTANVRAVMIRQGPKMGAGGDPYT